MAKYRKKPIAVEAVQWTGSRESTEDIQGFCPEAKFRRASGKTRDEMWFIIPTRDGSGDFRAEIGDYIIRGVNGDFYPCKPDIFRQTYSYVDEVNWPVLKYTKRPVVIEALQWDGTHKGYEDIQNFCPTAKYRWTPARLPKVEETRYLIIPTLEGDHRAEPGEFIIKGIQGEFYPCKRSVFEKTYELVEEE